LVYHLITGAVVMLQAERVLKRLRKICLTLPETSETTSWGHPNFRAGKKMFAALDEYQGQLCIAFKTTLEEQARLVKDERYFEAPYSGHLGWVCLKANGKIDWEELKPHLIASYRLVALKRMITALDGES
jgi:predicted DNA-binding protein (MmcQ/YjbR family)